ncbi:hypothetical protein [Amycolatopsis minnesotensis]|uniref:Uncharacterized protein n=1 Tax=Amycolatopsis minnesotensis TaxID=337894 RepID=A0ABN2R3Z3_9PSEU
MRLGSEPDATRRARGPRSTGAVSMLVGIVSAAALTGVAFYTVEQASCADPGQYIRHDNHVELVGGCVNTAELTPARPGVPAAVEGSGPNTGAKFQP